MFNNGTPGTCNNYHVIIHITTQYNISCLIIYVLRDLHLIPMPNLKVFFLNTFQFTTQSGNVCFMHEQGNSEIEIKLKISCILYATTFCIVRTSAN